MLSEPTLPSPKIKCKRAGVIIGDKCSSYFKDVFYTGQRPKPLLSCLTGRRRLVGLFSLNLRSNDQFMFKK